MTCALEIIGTASKSKVSRVLPGRQAGFGEMALDAAAVAFGQLVLGEGGQEAGGGPAFLVGLFGELRPDELDGGQAQLVEQQAERGGVDSGGRLHAASPVRAGAEQGFVDIERSKVHDDVGQRGGIGREAGPQSGHVGQAAGLEIGGQLIGQLGLAAALVGQGEKIDHDAAGLPLRQPLQEHVEGSPIGLAREQLVAIDQVEQRHRLAAQRMDDMAVVDDLVVLAVGMRAPARQRHELRAADEDIRAGRR